MLITDNMEMFTEFIKELENITIKETIDVPIIKKLVHLHNKEANVRLLLQHLQIIIQTK